MPLPRCCTIPFLFLVLIGTNGIHAQLDRFSVMGIPTATASQIQAVTGAAEGAMAYATDEDNLYIFDGSNWTAMVRQSALNVYSGTIIVSSTGNITVSGLPFEPRNITFVAHANVETPNLNSDNAVGNNNSGLANSFGTSNGFARNDGGTIVQQNIYIGGSGNSINDISRFASSSHCVGIRYGNQNGNNLGETTVSLIAFNPDGFTLNTDSFADGLVVIYTAYD